MHHLEEAVLPAGATRIGSEAFSVCQALRNLTVPASVAEIGGQAFDSCTNLVAVFFHGNAPSAGSSIYTNANRVTSFYKPGTTVGRRWGSATALWVSADDFTYVTNLQDTITITGYIGAGGEVIIPSYIESRSVTEIGDHAFFTETGITGLEIPDSVRTIGPGAFSGAMAWRTWPWARA